MPSDGLNVQNTMKPATTQRSRERIEPRMAIQVRRNWPASRRTRGSRMKTQAMRNESVGNTAAPKKASRSSWCSVSIPPATPTAIDAA